MSPVLVLGGLFAVALFLRAYFAFDLAVRDFLVSGGSDSYYFGWILDNIVTTGRHLLQDRMLNFPVGMLNPRPPLYAWSVALVGMLVGNLQGSVPAGVGQTFLFSTAVWGALTIFPTYFLAKEIFGRRTAYVAAFFLALLPAHIQRTPLSNGDHDALVLFFVVTAFYFLLKALAGLRERPWVEAWWRPRAVVGGLRDLVRENRRTILLSIMAGTALAAIALTWKGWAYAVVIIVVYFLAQLLVHKIRNQDPLGILLVFAVTLGTAHLLAAPYYVTSGQVRTWFDVPLYLFLASLGVGLVFTVFHRLPWMLVVPPIILGFAAGTAIAAVYSPTVAAAVGSGLGYFVPNKVFETIAEAQPPNLSQVILSFGAVTFYFSLAGVVLLALQFLRRPRPDFLFVLVWIVAAIFMALSAVRFLFNASPAFAITSAWIVILIVERLGLDQVGKAVASTGGSRLGALRRGIKIRHVVGVLLVTFLVVLPNTWFAVDAGSPFEIKEDLEQEVLRVTPDFLRPPAADQGLFYFGAFGYTLPLPSRYFPQAWSWLQEQDADIVPTWDRPAFLSWWDYGFESIQEGRHPAVADNFQNGIEFAGHFLTSQSENEGIAVLNVRLLLGDVTANRGQLSQATAAILVAHGLDPDHILDALLRPALFIPLIRAEPERFGEWDTRLSAANARVIYLRTVLVEALDLDAQAELYRDLRIATGTSIGYFAVDSRLIPFSGTNAGIFYAVVKLTDHRTAELPDGRSIPVDFYRLVAVTNLGEFDLDQVPSAAQIQNIRIEYKDAWYRTMLYRIFFGPDGESLGLQNEGLPGLSGALERTDPRHGWMLEHFRMVYRTAYFSPHPPDQVANFTEDFTALNIFDALELQEQINAGEIEGTVDVSPQAGLRRGIVILQYYDGALLRGRVTTEAGTPVVGVRVTTLDDLLTPHEVTFTDDRGFYEASLPFGRSTVAVSSGPADAATGIGGTLLVEEVLNVSTAQAFRIPLDEGGTGQPSFVVTRDFVVKAGTFRGTAFVDVDGNGVRDPAETGLPGLEVGIQDIAGEAPDTTTVTGLDGAYELANLIPTRYRLSLTRNGEEVASVNITLGQGEVRDQDLVVSGAALSGFLTDEFGQPLEAATVRIVEEATGQVISTQTGDDGGYRLDGLFEGEYTVEAEAGARGTFPRRVALLGGTAATLDLRLEPQGTMTGRSLLSFVPTPHVTLTMQRRGDVESFMVTSDASAQFAIALPLGIYDAYALHFATGKTYGFLGPVTVGPGSQAFDLNLRPAHRIEGLVEQQDGGAAQATVTFEKEGARHAVTSELDGSFVAFLPTGQYQVVALNATGQHVSTLTVAGSTEATLTLALGVATDGRVFRDLNGNGTYEPGEGLPGIRVRVSTASAPAFSVLSGTEGTFALPLLANASYTWSVEEEGFAPVAIGPLSPGELRSLPPIGLVALNVSVAGQLTALEPLDLEGLNVTFEAVSHGAVSTTVTTGPQGSLTTSLQPGIYLLSVDTEAPPEDGSRRIQGEGETQVRVPVGGGIDPVPVPVVERVRVQGTLDAGGPLGVAVLFDGPDRAFVKAEGSYLVYLRRGTYTISGATDIPAPQALLATLEVTDPTDFNATFEPAATLGGTLLVEGNVVAPGLSLAFTRVADGARVVVPSDGSGGYSTILVPGTYQATAEWVGVDRLDGVNRFVRYVLDQTVVLADDGDIDLLFARELDMQAVEVRILLGRQLVSARVTFAAANETALNTTVDVPGGAPFAVALAPGAYHVYAFRDVGKSAALAEITVLPDGPAALAVPLEQGYRVFGVASLADGSRRPTQLEFRTLAGSATFTTNAQGGYEIFLPAGPYEILAFAERIEEGVPVEYRFEGTLDLGDSMLLNPLLARVEVRTLEVTWDPAQQALIAPGETVVYTITVTNTGNRVDTFAFSGRPEHWTFSFRPSRVTLPFDTGNAAQVTVQITAPEDAKVAEGALTVVAQSTTDPSVVALGSLTVDILQFRGLSLGLGGGPPILDAEALRYQIDVRNDGNGDEAFDLVLANRETLAAQGWNATLVYQNQTSPEAITGILVPAGESLAVTLRLEPAGRVSTSTATLVAFSQEDRKVESTLNVAVGFPSLEIPRDQLQVEGKNVLLGPPEFPILLYGALAAAAIGLTVLFLTYGRRRRRRR
ncbi:MAG: carboxypeptidase regulatory-like domain-containing protein [Thermoplasmata archaeon]